VISAGRLIAITGLATVAAATPAVADEGEKALSVYGGVASFAVDGEDTDATSTGIGFGIGADYEHGITETLWLRVSGGGALYTGRPTSASGQATFGLTYVFDVLKYVPYGHVGVGGALLYADRAPDEPEPLRERSLVPLVELGGGLDILSNPDFSWGVHLRLQSFVTDTALFTGGIRVSWRWGFF
jgi:hypothetical protein